MLDFAGDPALCILSSWLSEHGVPTESSKQSPAVCHDMMLHVGWVRETFNSVVFCFYDGGYWNRIEIPRAAGRGVLLWKTSVTSPLL